MVNLILNPVQILVEYNGKTSCHNFNADREHAASSIVDNNGVLVSLLLDSVSKRVGPPSSFLKLIGTHGECAPSDFIPNGSTIKCQLKGGLRGGKGGFGAALRMSGRGGQGTTNFSACRDLNGRRLRHVNNEIRLKRWNEEQAARKRAKEKGIPYITDTDANKTKSGIDNWHLALPSWAEGVKRSKKARPRKMELCWHWKAAREQGQRVPDGAPPCYGCPKGKHCSFAHGEADLSDAGKLELKSQRREAKIAEEHKSIKKFSDEVAQVQEQMADAVAQGMKVAMQVQAVASSVTEPSTSEVSVSRVIPLEGISGEVGIGETGEIEGRSAFGSASTLGIAVKNGCWVYEVEILTGGVGQVGWASDFFNPSETNNDGVGDIHQSWGYDGSKQTLWDGGIERQQFGVIKWTAGDIVGLELDVCNLKGSCFLNGALVGTFALGEISDGQLGYYPAVSVEQGEVVRLNLGERVFRFGEKYSSKAMAVLNAPEASIVEEVSSKVLVQNEGESISTQSIKTSNIIEENASTKVVEEIDLEKFNAIEELKSLGLDMLKEQLVVRGLKAGGSLDERCARLWQVRGLQKRDYPSDLLAGAARKRKRNKTSPK